MEQWRAIPGFDGYEVSDLGRVRSWRPAGALHPKPTEPRILTGIVRSSGYVQVTLYGDRQATKRVNRLVLEAFVGLAPSPDHEAAHWDGDKTNNQLGNLRWATEAQNAADRERHGRTARGSKNGNAKLTEESVAEIRRRHANGERKRPLAREFGVDRRTVSFIVSGHTWKTAA